MNKIAGEYNCWITSGARLIDENDDTDDGGGDINDGWKGSFNIVHCLLYVVATKNNYELIIGLKMNQKEIV